MESTQKKPVAKIHFLFTEQGFLPDNIEVEYTEEVSAWKERFDRAPYQTLYELGFVEKPD